MPDGKRKRRHSPNHAKRQWYARYRALRFGWRFGLCQAWEQGSRLRGGQVHQSKKGVEGKNGLPAFGSCRNEG